MAEVSGLLITLQRGSTIFSLKSDECLHSFSRFGTQVPLPTSEGSSSLTFLLDLGMVVEQISVKGIVDTEGDPSKADIENVCRTWWGYTNFIGTSNLILLTIDSGQGYYVALKNAEFKREAAKEDRWGMSATFLVAQKVTISMPA
jgi:hypothetical protein